jgi:hypothetical protein
MLLGLVAAVACSRGPGPGTSLTGAPTARDAATEFMNAVKAQDLQAMATVWGNERGSARDNMDRRELEQRLIIIQGCYEHDRFQVLNESPGAQGVRLIRVQITRGSRSKTPNFQVVQGPSNRWYVLDADFETMRDFCAR